MKRIILFITAVSFATNIFAQTGTGWAQQRAKVNFKDSINIAKGWKINGTFVLPSVAEINYVDGVTSAIQTQIDALVPFTGALYPVNLGAEALTTTGLVTTGSLATEVLSVGDPDSFTYFGIDSIPTNGTTYSIFDGATQLAPSIPASAQAELSTYAVMIYDTAGNAPGNYMTRQNYYNDPSNENILKSLRGLGGTIRALPIVPMMSFTVGQALSDAVSRWTIIRVDETFSCTGVMTMQETQGVYTGNAYNGLALYSISGTTYTKIDTTANDANIWTAADDAIITKTWAGGAHTLTPGYYIIMLVYNQSAQTTAPKLYGAYNPMWAFYNTYLPDAKEVMGTISAIATPPHPTTNAAAITASTTAMFVALY